jgi:hypothetical protein
VRLAHFRPSFATMGQNGMFGAPSSSPGKLRNGEGEKSGNGQAYNNQLRTGHSCIDSPDVDQ